MAPSSASRFSKPQYFTPDVSGRGWNCNICVSKRTNQFYFPNMRAALRHEQTFSEHARHISEAEAEWWKPQGDRSWGSSDPPRLTSEGLRTWEMQTHVDHVYDLVPFWMRGVDAAERGEVLRMEEFLQKMEADGGWRTADEVWGMLEGWSPPNHQEGSDGWGRRDVPSVHKGGTDSTSDDQSTGWVAKEEWGVLSDHSSPRDRENVTHPFVDGIARQESADEKKRRRMHQFFRMPTEQKVLKIQETIRYLRTHPA